MINNYSKNIYHALRNLSVPTEENKTKTSGLLSPVKSFMRKTESKNKQPVLTVKQSWDLLNNTRNRINGKNA